MKIKFTKALLGEKWQDHVSLTINGNGVITAIETTDRSPGAGHITGFALPPLANIHSHAFQRAMAGCAEYTTGRRDSFWSWREEMYRFAQKITPDDLYHIARLLYLEMVLAGYGTVVEFHYLHHQPGGKPYDDRAEMSHALIHAAEEVGLTLTLLPVLYMTSGFDGAPLNEPQARFGQGVEEYCRLLDQLSGCGPRTGAAFHSLRAVPPAAMTQVMCHLNALDRTAPVHIHIAEQMKEVEDCIAWCGQRPVEWLLNHQDVNARWCLVHATHLTGSEITALARSGATAGLCPTTEANLGDGLFPMKDFLSQGGQFAIGSDSHISVSVTEELRLLEYGQRLKYHQRNIITDRNNPHCGTALYLNSLKGGVLASGQNSGSQNRGAIEVGQKADFIILDSAAPRLMATPDDKILDRYVFSGNVNLIKDVMIGGKWLVRDGEHILAPQITAGFKKTMDRLS